MGNKIPVYKFIAQTLSRVQNIAKGGDAKRADGIFNDLGLWVKRHGPSGSGIDMGTALSEMSDPGRIVLGTHFHHMDEHGGYDGWTEHKVTVKASMLFGIDITVGGRNRNDIKELLHQTYHHWLTSEVANGLVEGMV